MSYCRFRTDSDVYMYPHVDGYIVCCACGLMDSHVVFQDELKAIMHLVEHCLAGDKVLARALHRLLREAQEAIEEGRLNMDFRDLIASLVGLLSTGGTNLNGTVVSTETCVNIMYALAGSEDDFVLFDGGSGELFTVWRGADKVREIANNDFVATHYLYAIARDGQSTIYKMPIRLGRQRIHWECVEGESNG